ncbi:MAG: bifunctional 4-hydroxy-2-oxoglutarate aldolase/2-dehydro-3-deoxy-phosphogluconate aldolase [Pseudomonadota bacterium]|uniref:bifunctional 4-hydroxy-2-oxoglutarate aldolase/2-dehydro-3-deoxy-phosphogluconate aldolase n=1 Tax=Gallaecimonas pentaromativorans TaxID=584787 RepID=UPI00067EF52A|nr:bifunctional 4-hydroxy-2-oxoglutarate aldolase/2-dehydro-3-deoxy-phosphogluconate aldolase [Gallaecimonas pentaromativorans]MED5525590.1 bifunctional 4-hydroxy-2-oxoglutarate aldolase/2-dehydro-3-deoxy-phosphogluconate aldolase [Pseudomonadota bacterium]
MTWKLAPQDVLTASPVMPVLVIEKLEHAVPLAKALVAGGIRVLEVTLRTDCALDAIAQIAKDVPDALVGAGTVLNGEDYEAAIAAGAKFVISPGMTPSLVQAALKGPAPLIPGVSTLSEVMEGMDLGLGYFKFFPAEASGGAPALKAMGGPIPQVKFCPTGGISEKNAASYLGLPNVLCVGGSWLAPKELIEAGDWDGITAIAKAASNLK